MSRLGLILNNFVQNKEKFVYFFSSITHVWAEISLQPFSEVHCRKYFHVFLSRKGVSQMKWHGNGKEKHYLLTVFRDISFIWCRTAKTHRLFWQILACSWVLSTSHKSWNPLSWHLSVTHHFAVEIYMTLSLLTVFLFVVFRGILALQVFRGPLASQELAYKERRQVHEPWS